MHIDQIFQKLWVQYSTENPSVKKIHKLFHDEGEVIVNDHVAFRTFNDERVNISVLSKPFLNAGYKEAGEYYFPDKKLYAKHFEKEGYPRVFISELELDKCSLELKETVEELLDAVDRKKFDDDNLILSGNIFGILSYATYLKLRKESEYAAWLYAYGYRANHFTISINHLKKYNTIEKLNDFLKLNSYELNTSGGEIKGSPAQFLQQSSTLADRINLNFREGDYEIPSCYYEFALRHKGSNGELFSGFIAGSADKIFESTDYR